MFKEFAIAPAYHTAGNFPDPFWRKYIHPSGWLYYRHERDRVLTTVNITDPDEFRTLQRRHRDAGDVFDFPSDGRFTPYLGAFNSDWEITVDHTGYRWIDHAHAFAGEIDQTLTSFLDSVIRFEGKADEALEMRERYWAFLQSHPCHHFLPAHAERHVEDVLTWCLADQTLFATSTASFTREQAQQLLDILKSLPEPNTRPVEENMRSYAICLRIWYTSAIARTIAADRMSLRYGQPEARIFRELEKHSEITQFSDPAFNGLGFAIFFAVSFVLFFGIPASCLRQIMDVNRRRFSGGGVNETRWRSFLQSRLKDWSDSNLLATVLIAATVAFIAVPGIDDASRSLTLLSALLSIGSVLTGQYLSRTHQPQITSTAQTGALYFRNVGSSRLLAILLSLPIILISWSFIAFVIAFVVYSFRGNDGSSTPAALPRSTALIVTITTGGLTCLLLIIVLVFWGAWDVMRRQPSSSTWPSYRLRETNVSNLPQFPIWWSQPNQLFIPTPADPRLFVPQTQAVLPGNNGEPVIGGAYMPSALSARVYVPAAPAAV